MSSSSHAVNVRLPDDLVRRVDRVQRWLAERLPGATRTDAMKMLLARGLDVLESVDPGLSAEDRAWMRADLSRLGDVEPYDFGGADPETLGDPVEHRPDGSVLIEAR
jgi:hypothetical protein